MYGKSGTPRIRSTKSSPWGKNREHARFKAATKVLKYAPGHRNKPHDSHSGQKH